MSDYGHDGPLVEDEYTRQGDVRKTIRCERCNCMVPRDNPEMLEDVDCDEYAELQESL